MGGDGAREKTDKSGVPFWVHRVGDPLPSSRLSLGRPPPHHDAKREAPSAVHQVYAALLARLYLSSCHRRNLNDRGLTDADIDTRGYRSLAPSQGNRIARELSRKFGAEVLVGVPGFAWKEGPYGSFLSLCVAPGLLVPLRDVDGRIVALAIRLDNPGGAGKYRFASSSSAGGPSALPACHVPIAAERTDVIRISEGALKADIASALGNRLCLGLPGCGAWRTALPVLERLQPKTIWLSLDADFRTNPHVAIALAACAKHLHEQGFNVKVESWHPRAGKGVDDVLVNGNKTALDPWHMALVAKHRSTARPVEEMTRGKTAQHQNR